MLVRGLKLMSSLAKTYTVLEAACPLGIRSGAQELPSGSLADWTKEIRTVFAKGKSSTIKLAKVVHAARQKLAFGEWTELFRSGEIPFSKRKGEMLVAIGQSMGKLNANTCSHLPTAWRTLYYLSKLDRTELLALIAKGTIHPALTIQKAKELLGLRKSESNDNPRSSAIKRRLSNFRKFVQGALHDWTGSEREMVRLALLQLALGISHGNASAAKESRSENMNGSCSARGTLSNELRLRPSYIEHL